jgi:hypothetical protein
MSDIDRQRIAAVKTLRLLGFVWHEGQWAKSGETELQPGSDAMHAVLVNRADDLAGCSEGSREEKELASIADAVMAYEQKRWPLGKELGGKG